MEDSPVTSDRMNQVRELLHACMRMTVEQGGSDLHLRPGEVPFMRRNSRLQPIEGMPELDGGLIDEMFEVLSARVPDRVTEFRAAGEADLAYSLEDVARFRVNVFRERGRPAMTLRAIPSNVPLFDNLQLPEAIRTMSNESHGLILVTGATGSGKTTTLAAMIDHINRTFAKHILTIEDPIEIVHPNHSSLVSQREVGTDTADFQQALRRALRQDPDVILIGEIRDEETMRTALAAAETGHLVLATLHTINAAESIARVLDLFPSDAESQARAMLAGALKGIVSQRLARTVDDSRVAVVEVMVNTNRISDMITTPEETGKITEAIEEGEFYGMQSFDQALLKLIMAGRIDEEEAMHHVTSRQDFKLKLESARAQSEADARHAAEVAAAEAAAAERAAAEAAAAAQHHPLPGSATVPGAVPVPAEYAPPAPAAPLPVADPALQAPSMYSSMAGNAGAPPAMPAAAQPHPVQAAPLPPAAVPPAPPPPPPHV